MVTTDEERMKLTFFHALFDNASDGYIVADQHLRVRYLNQTAKNWFGEPDLTNDTNCYQLLKCGRTSSSDTRREDQCKGCHLALERTNIFSDHINVKKQDGNTFPVSISYSYIPWNHEESYLLLALRDISLQKKHEQERIMNDALHYTIAERERIARDLHDTVAQDLAYTALRLKQLRREWANFEVIEYEKIAKELSDIDKIVDQSIQELRNSLYDLNFELETDFFQFVRDHVVQLELRSGIKTDIEIEDSGMPWADRVEVQLARMIKEVLTNVNKHSRAHHVQLWLKRTRTEMMIKISDDGIGFNLEAEESEPRHYGIRSILERCRIIGGTANVRSQPGHGTEWSFRIPAHYDIIPDTMPVNPDITRR